MAAIRPPGHVTSAKRVSRTAEYGSRSRKVPMANQVNIPRSKLRTGIFASPSHLEFDITSGPPRLRARWPQTGFLQLLGPPLLSELLLSGPAWLGAGFGIVVASWNAASPNVVLNAR